MPLLRVRSILPHEYPYSFDERHCTLTTDLFVKQLLEKSEWLLDLISGLLLTKHDLFVQHSSEEGLSESKFLNSD